MPSPRRERDRDKTPSRLYEPSYSQRPEPTTKKKTPSLFLRATAFFSKIAPSFGKNSKFSQEQEEAFSFLDWGTNPRDFRSAYFGIMLSMLAATVVLVGASYLALFDQNPENPFFIAIAGIMLLASVIVPFVYSNYPKSAASREKLLALAYVPEIVNYLTMSLRLTPNLEKAVEFAASHGQGKIA